MFTRLLVGLDGSAGADAALGAAIGLGRRFRSALTLVSVTDIRLLEAPLFETAGPLWTEGVPIAPPSGELRAALEERATGILAAGAERATAEGLAVERVHAVGLVDEELVRLGEKADAVVVGRRGEGHARAGTVGTVTAHLIKRCTKPVLVAGDQPSACESPVVAYDGREASTHALALAARFAEATGISLDVVHVSDKAEEGEALLSRAGAFLSSHGILFRTHRLEGDIGRAVGAFVEERGADLVVAGAHGGRRRSWAVGSQAERLIQLTTVPVIINR